MIEQNAYIPFLGNHELDVKNRIKQKETRNRKSIT